eukprot:COSAG01_NODE_1241_length_11085_cov_9.712361_9_plen_45_part_00
MPFEGPALDQVAGADANGDDGDATAMLEVGAFLLEPNEVNELLM